MGGYSCFVTLFSQNVKSLGMISKIPGTIMNTKYNICSFQLQCNAVFSDQLNLAICQTLSTGKNNYIFHSNFLCQFVNSTKKSKHHICGFCKIYI